MADAGPLTRPGRWVRPGEAIRFTEAEVLSHPLQRDDRAFDESDETYP